MSANRKLFQHYSEFPMDQWRWQNFQPVELACNGTGQLMVDFHSMDCLQALREMLDAPIYLNSAFRSEWWNAKVGGAKASQHLEAKAFDPSMQNHDPHQFEAAARECGFTAFGYYVDQNFMHIDTRDRPAKWGTPFERQDDEPTPHEVLAKCGPIGTPVGPPVRIPGFARKRGFAPRRAS